MISSSLFGSIYIFSKSLKQINDVLLNGNKRILNNEILKLNTLTCIISGLLFLYNFRLFYEYHFNFSRI